MILVKQNDISITNKTNKINSKGRLDLKCQRFLQDYIVQEMWLT